MPYRRERDDTDELTDEQEGELVDEMAAALAELMGESAFPTEDAKREAWEAHGQRLTREYVEKHPGRRPPGWWAFECSRRFPVFVEDRPEGAPPDLCNESAWLWELGELGEAERHAAPGPNPAERAYMEGP